MAEKKIPRGFRNNNPGNIRINRDLFQGEIRPSQDKSFKQFETMAYGYRAIFRILRNYYNNYKLETICKMIGRWAPENENDTDSFLSLCTLLHGSRLLRFLFFCYHCASPRRRVISFAFA